MYYFFHDETRSYERQATYSSLLYHLPRYTVCVKSPRVSYCLYLTEISWLISNMQILLYYHAAAGRARKPKYAVGGGTIMHMFVGETTVYYGRVMFSSDLTFISLFTKMYSMQSVILRKRKCYPSSNRKKEKCRALSQESASRKMT